MFLIRIQYGAECIDFIGRTVDAHESDEIANNTERFILLQNQYWSMEKGNQTVTWIEPNPRKKKWKPRTKSNWFYLPVNNQFSECGTEVWLTIISLTIDGNVSLFAMRMANPEEKKKSMQSIRRLNDYESHKSSLWFMCFGLSSIWVQLNQIKMDFHLFGSRIYLINYIRYVKSDMATTLFTIPLCVSAMMVVVAGPFLMAFWRAEDEWIGKYIKEAKKPE